MMVGVAADVGVKEFKDLKGKRVAWVKGAPALNHNVTAFLAFAGLTWDDVEKVEFAGYGASWAGMTSRSEEHTSELQSLMRISYAVFCLKKKKKKHNKQHSI